MLLEFIVASNVGHGAVEMREKSCQWRPRGGLPNKT
jgi:hypothetical protein